MTTVLLLDDHPLIVNGVARQLDCEDGIEVIGKVHNPGDALQFLRTNPVHIFVSDMHLSSELSGIDLLIQIKQHYPATKVIFYTMVEKNSDVREAILAGAEGYVLKKYDADEVCRAIQSVMVNKKYYSPELVHILVRTPVAVADQDEQPEALRTLTPRELEVMKLIAQDVPNGQIAYSLSLSESTINSHRSNLMQKLGVRSNVGIAHFAFKYGLVDYDLP